MNEVLDFRNLVQSGLLPSDCRMLRPEMVKLKCLPIGKVQSMQTPNLVSIRNVVSDKVVWACFSKKFGLYSCDGEKVYRFNQETKEFTTYIVKDRLIPIKINDLKKLEDEKMNNPGIEDALAGLKQSMGADLGLNDAKVFDGNTDLAAKVEDDVKKVQRTNLINTLSKEVEGISLADTRKLKAYNYEKATLLGWITERDVKTRSFVKSDKITNKQTGKFELENAPQNIVSDYNSGKDIDPKYFKRKTSLQFKQDMPGPIRYAVFNFPIDGLIPVEDLRNPDKTIDLDPRKATDFITTFVPKDDIPFYVNAYLGKHVKEDPRTHENPSKLSVITTVKTNQNKETNLIEQVKKTSMKIASKKSLVQKGNYFPRVTYNTVKVSEIGGNAELMEKANVSLFENIFKSTKTRARSWDKLGAEDKQNVQEVDGKIVSKFLDPKVNLAIDIKDCFTGEVIANPEITLKVKKEKKDKTGFTYQLDKFDATQGGDSPINPFTSGKYENFLAACNGALTQSKLNELFAKKSTGSSKSSGNVVELDDEQALKLLFKSSEEGLVNFSGSEKSFGKGKIDQIGSEIFSILARNS